MMMFQLLVVVLASLPASWGEQRLVESTLRWDMPPPPGTSDVLTRNVLTSWVTMPLDHFDPQNPDTFQMRYMFNEEFFGGDGYPVFILIGGEWNIVPGWLQAGNMYEMARENHGYQIYTEHRYYGATLPSRKKILLSSYRIRKQDHKFLFFIKNFTPENLRFLNGDQALADLAYFILQLKKQPRFAKSKIVLYGGSYAANMALWFKQRYPHLVVGGVASSGPIKAKVDFTGYLEVVHEAFLAEGGQHCIDIIKQGIDETVAALQTPAGRQVVQNTYRLCNPINYNNPYELGYISGLISWTFSTSVQQAVPGTLLNICTLFNSNVFGVTPMQRVAGYINFIRNLPAGSCWNMRYEDYVGSYTNQTSNSVAWYYQTCTEYGYYQTAPRIGTVFDGLKWLSIDFYVDMCKQAFDQRFDSDFVHAAVDRVNLVFGGLQPRVNNTINIHGAIDPWHALGVHEQDLKDSSPTITVPRASHCFDMRGWVSSDTILMTQAQQAARRMVAGWLAD